jgi:hypothetical protein
MQHFRDAYHFATPRDRDSLDEKLRFVSNDGKITRPHEIYILCGAAVNNFTPPQNCNTKIIYGIVHHPYYFDIRDVIAYEPDIIRTNDIVYVNCNYCDKCGNTCEKPIRYENKYVSKFFVKIVYISSKSIYPNKKRKNACDRDDDRKR